VANFLFITPHHNVEDDADKRELNFVFCKGRNKL